MSAEGHGRLGTVACQGVEAFPHASREKDAESSVHQNTHRNAPYLRIDRVFLWGKTTTSIITQKTATRGACAEEKVPFPGLVSFF